MQPRKQESLPGQKKFNFFHFSCHIFDFLTFILMEHVKRKRILSGRAGAGVDICGKRRRAAAFREAG